ncbi:MAG: hypothetical protein P8182_01870 [Deltaproteobacteria bacterium]
MPSLAFSRQMFVISLLLGGMVLGASLSAAVQSDASEICRPSLGKSPTIEMGRSGLFEWTCPGGTKKSSGFYIVFIRPSGTYVLLKVPQGRDSFEFTPDTPGMWRWIVINTDPDPTKPDLESDQGYFQVILTDETSRGSSG